ncbi:hypothetical protein [Caldithrix abyssi]|uniref:Uncharacterized protein n=1 Tax=Caldithrix abyssi DSM 13497 TaxID=880073 RepID=A0A1J1CCG4_CALAY|nr:hypothetical protein [Caldithrix abyssi]APF20405.1 hypothetical protein Cabys_3659 [Caldithrix abyssi DSM 13497]
MIFFLCDGDFTRIEQIRRQKYIDALWFMSKLLNKQDEKNEEVEIDEF